MGLQSSGSISLSNIAGEFGGSAPHSLSEYYNADSGVPASGQISFSQFYGKSSMGTPVVFISHRTFYTQIAYDGNGKVVIVYRDDENSYRGTAVVGTLNGSSISFGSPVVFDNAMTTGTNVTHAGNGKVVVVYTAPQDGSKGKAVVGTVSGNSISFGPTVTFGNERTQFPSATYAGNGRVIIVYSNPYSSPGGRAVAGTVSGTSFNVSPFSYPFGSSGVSLPRATFDTSNNAVFITYRASGSGEGYKASAIAGTLMTNVQGGSNLGFSFGSNATFSTNSAESIFPVYDSANQKVVVTYSESNEYIPVARVVNISGTSLSFNSPVAIHNSGAITRHSATYDSVNGKIVCVISDANNSDQGIAYEGTLSGGSISFGSPIIFAPHPDNRLHSGSASTYEPVNGKVVVAYPNMLGAWDNWAGTAVAF